MLFYANVVKLNFILKMADSKEATPGCENL